MDLIKTDIMDSRSFGVGF